MTAPTPQSKYRRKVRDELLTAYSGVLSDAQADAIVDYVWGHAGGTETVFDSRLRAFVAGQRTWWETPTLRTG